MLSGQMSSSVIIWRSLVEVAASNVVEAASGTATGCSGSCCSSSPTSSSSLISIWTGGSKTELFASGVGSSSIWSSLNFFSSGAPA